MESRYVIFEGKKHDIIPSCVVFQWYQNGIVHMIFPQWVATLDFTHDDRFPLDPNTMRPVIISPEVRKNINKQEWVNSYAKGFTPPTNKKQSMLREYAPYFAILLVVLLGFWMYNNMSGLAMQMESLRNAFNAIVK